MLWLEVGRANPLKIKLTIPIQRKRIQVAVVSKGRHINRPLRPSREKESLLLARTRLLSDIQSTENPRYKLFLETSLAAVDKQISEIQ